MVDNSNPYDNYSKPEDTSQYSQGNPVYDGGNQNPYDQYNNNGGQYDYQNQAQSQVQPQYQQNDGSNQDNYNQPQTPQQEQYAYQGATQYDYSRESSASGYSSNGPLVRLELGEAMLKSSSPIDKFFIYPIKGQDAIGEIDIARRYSEFLAFRNALQKNYPGLYIPPLSSKTSQSSTNKTSKALALERQYFLHQFCIGCCQLHYISASQEFQAFLRPQGSVEDSLKRMPKPKTNDILNLYRSTIHINENEDDRNMKLMEQDIDAFIKDHKEIQKHLKTFKQLIKSVVPIKDQQNGYYKQFAAFLIRYEQAEAGNHAANEKVVRLISVEGEDDVVPPAPVKAPETPSAQPQVEGEGGEENKIEETITVVEEIKVEEDPSKMTLKRKIEYMSNQQKNPFAHIRNWIKGEIYQGNALVEAIKDRDNMDQKKRNAINALEEKRKTAEKLKAGKFTFKGLLKNQTEKAAAAEMMTSTFDQLEQDIQNYDQIKRFLTLYLYQVGLPDYRKKRVNNYLTAMKLMVGEEITNSQLTQNTWNAFNDQIQTVKVQAKC